MALTKPKTNIQLEIQPIKILYDRWIENRLYSELYKRSVNMLFRPVVSLDETDCKDADILSGYNERACYLSFLIGFKEGLYCKEESESETSQELQEIARNILALVMQYPGQTKEETTKILQNILLECKNAGEEYGQGVKNECQE